VLDERADASVVDDDGDDEVEEASEEVEVIDGNFGGVTGAKVRGSGW
jgi:hypothetical protein